MVVARLGARAPLRSIARTAPPPFTFRKFGLGGHSNARKNIFGVSPQDGDRNLKIASQLLQSSVESFVKEWNFDPVTATPLAAGRYSWIRFQPPNPTTPKLEVETNQNLSKSSEMSVEESGKIDATLSVDEKIDSFPSENKGDEEGKSMILPSCTKGLFPLINNLNLNSASPQIPGEGTPKAMDLLFPKSFKAPSDRKKLRQTKITDYGRIVKRKQRLLKLAL